VTETTRFIVLVFAAVGIAGQVGLAQQSPDDGVQGKEFLPPAGEVYLGIWADPAQMPSCA